jgi:hypothetical protein
MALTPVRTQPAQTVGHVSHDAQARVDKRVTEILARRAAARATVARAREGTLNGRAGRRLGDQLEAIGDGPPSRAP